MAERVHFTAMAKPTSYSSTNGDQCPRCDKQTACREEWRDPKTRQVVSLRITCANQGCVYRFSVTRRVS